MIQYDDIECIAINTVFVLRHSIRDKVTDPANHGLVPLNEEGRKLAVSFGESLRGKTNKLKFYSSHVQRCVETCECIAKGFGLEAAVEITDNLGGKGTYITDKSAADKTYLDLGPVKVAEMLQNNQPVVGLRSLKEGSGILLDFIKSTLDDDCTTIMVTHDSQLAYFINAYTDEYFCADHWPEFLDGVVIRKEYDGSLCLYRNNIKKQL